MLTDPILKQVLDSGWQPVTLTATLASSVSGNPPVEFFDGATPLGYDVFTATQATLTTTLTPGSKRRSTRTETSR